MAERQKFRNAVGTVMVPGPRQQIVTWHAAGLLIERLHVDQDTHQRRKEVLVVRVPAGLSLPGGRLAAGMPIKGQLLENARRELGANVAFKDFVREPLTGRTFEEFLVEDVPDPVAPVTAQVFVHWVVNVFAADPIDHMTFSEESTATWVPWTLVRLEEFDPVFRTAMSEYRIDRTSGYRL